MCVIIAKPSGKEMPKKTVLEKCWHSNIDGAGFSVTQKDGSILIKKGFMNFPDFFSAVSTCEKSDTVVIHFRRTTQGTTNPGLTHPFPLDFSKREERMRELAINTCCAVSHNGDIPMTGTRKFRKSFPDSSDTEIFVRDYMPKLVEKLEDLKDSTKLEILQALIGPTSKLAIHTKEGIQLVGWFDEQDGVYFSNFTNSVNFDMFKKIQ
ncbi:MAG: hypothetical protein FWD89_03435 [Firmicutes bacterium]|nr:hypothetical protein [Bacillota bacterium]